MVELEDFQEALTEISSTAVSIIFSRSLPFLCHIYYVGTNEEAGVSGL